MRATLELCHAARTASRREEDIPDERWGEGVHAVVVLKAGQTTTQEALIRHCREHLAGYKCPRSLEVRQEPLPLSGAGKILKRELRAPFWAGQSRAVH